jgi:hypothetical protein
MNGILHRSLRTGSSSPDYGSSATFAQPQRTNNVWDQLLTVLNTDALASETKPVGDVWGPLRAHLKVIEAQHAKYDDVEMPRLSSAVLTGARRLIQLLELTGEEPPTGMMGTCDGTITFEWHHWCGPQSFRSLDVLNENEVEEFIMVEHQDSILRTLTF